MTKTEYETDIIKVHQLNKDKWNNNMNGRNPTIPDYTGSQSLTKETPKHNSSIFMDALKTICEEKGIDDFLVNTTDNIDLEIYTLKHNNNIGTPRLIFTWRDQSSICDIVKIHMINPVKQYNKRVNLKNDDKWKSKIEESIEKLIEQNVSYIQTKTHLENKVTELGIKAESITKFKSHWQIDFKYNNKNRGAIIQFDPKTKEFLFQLRYSNEGNVFRILEQLSGDLDGI